MAKVPHSRGRGAPQPHLDSWAEDLPSEAAGWWQMNAFVNYLLERILKLDARSAADAGITERQHKALLFIRGAPVADDEGWVPLPFIRGCLLADIATASQLIGRMRAKGLVAAKRPIRNGPAYVRLTLAGERALTKVAVRNAAALKRLSDELGPTKLPKVLDHILNYLAAGPEGVPARSGRP